MSEKPSNRKSVAKSLKSLPDDEVFKAILDPNSALAEIIEEVKASWSYDLYSRKPGPALLEDGVLTPTDLDMACFLSALVERQAVINIPHYESCRAQTVREGERILSKENRHGQILGLVSNREVFSFSLRMKDMNVVQMTEGQPDQVGAFRCFMLVGLDGEWYPGWDRLEFSPTAKENEFLNDKSLWTGHTLYFKNFVHPNRWVSFYGKKYFITKALIQRLQAEASFWRTEVKRLQGQGARFPETGVGSKVSWPKTEKGESKQITVTAFEAEVDLGFQDWDFKSNELYAAHGVGQLAQQRLLFADKMVTKYTYADVPTLQFATRATELAFSNAIKRAMKVDPDRAYHVLMDGNDVVIPMPGHIKNAEWETYREKGKRTDWARLTLVQPFPFAKSLAIRFRVRQKTESVAA